MSGTETRLPKKPPSLDGLVVRIAEVSTLPQVAVKVMQIVNDPRAEVSDLQTIIEGDPALTVRLLRQVNSAAYSVQTRITNIEQAVAYLGFNRIRNLAITASVAKIFESDQIIGTYQRTMLWRHMVAVGVCARLVAARCELANAEDAFLAGLLHDIGIILEDQYVHGHFRAVLNELKDDRTLLDTEQEILGFDHAILGARMAENWRFPPLIRGAIRFHHMSGKYRGDDAAIIHCVEVGNILCTLKDVTSVGRKLVKSNSEPFLVLGLKKDDLRALVVSLEKEMEREASLFDLN